MQEHILISQKNLIILTTLTTTFISIVSFYLFTLYQPNYLQTNDQNNWSLSDWKIAEYEADVTAKSSYNVAFLEQKSNNLKDEYIAQAKAWHEIRELARRGSLGYVSVNQFISKKQDVYKQFGLIIPDNIHTYAVYQTLLKWAGWPAGFPTIVSFEKFNEQLKESPEKIQNLKDQLQILVFPNHQEKIPIQQLDESTRKKINISKNKKYTHNKSVKLNKPKSEDTILKLLNNLDYKSNIDLNNFSIWFGDDDGGFASILAYNLFQNTQSQWKNCWHPKWKLVGSCAQQTAIIGSDLDLLVVLNPKPEDAVNIEWREDGSIMKVMLKDQELTAKRIIQLWEIFWKSCQQNLTQTHPGDQYSMELTGSYGFTPAYIQLKIENTTADFLPALRTSDGSNLLFYIEEEGSPRLAYTNGSKAGRIIESYISWENFPELIKLLKILFREEWSAEYPKFPSSAFETIAIEVANEIGRENWENTRLIDLLHACIDRLVVYVDSKGAIYALNDPFDNLLGLHISQDLVSSFRSIIIKIKSYSTEKICCILENISDNNSCEYPILSSETC